MVYNFDVRNFGGSSECQAEWRLPAVTSDREALASFAADLLEASSWELVLNKEGRPFARGWYHGETLTIQLL